MKPIHNNFFSKKTTSSKLYLFLLLTFSGSSLFAQTNATIGASTESSVYSNPMFIGLLTIISLLLIIIIVLGGVLKNVATYTTKERKENATKIVGVVALVALLSASKNGMAQTSTIEAANAYMGLGSGLFYTLLSIIGFEILIILVLVNSIQLLVKSDVEKIKEKKKVLKQEPSFLDQFNASVSIEKEKDIMFDHEYDGIRELDNDLPPWWKYGFYVTIVFAFIYLVHYHVTSTGDLQAKEYDKSVEAAKIAKEEYAKKAANNVDENSVTLLTDVAQIEKGKTIFMEMCSACHGRAGEGGIGPNLTDDYWIHGGSLKNIFSSIKYGWPEKGMKSWQSEYSPVEIQALTTYIKNLRGTNPPNGKEKQGDLYVEEGLTPLVDSIVVDSSAAKIAIDSTAKK
jgi:cytochrome c oxidase cbb3-type subunit 3